MANTPVTNAVNQNVQRQAAAKDRATSFTKVKKELTNAEKLMNMLGYKK